MSALTTELVTVASIASGTTVRANKSDEITAGITFSITGLRLDFIQRGTANFYAEIRSSNAAYTTTLVLQRFRSGGNTTVWTQTTTSTVYTAFNNTQSILPGDVFIFAVRSSSSLGIGYMRNTQLRTSTTSAWIPTGTDSWYHNY